MAKKDFENKLFSALGQQSKNEVDIPKTTKQATIPEQKTELKKKKVGRPKEKVEETKNINVAIPISVMEKMDIAKMCYDKNLTKYINSLIKKDLDENFKKYLQINEQLKQLNMF